MAIDGPHFWSLSEAQELLVQAVVRGRKVIDLGGGNGSFAERLLTLGASEVTVLDKESPREYPILNLHWIVDTTFAEFAHTCQDPTQWDVAVLSWPANNHTIDPIIPILKRIKQLIILSQNWGGSFCGTVELWSYLVSRKVTAHLIERQSSLIIYGEQRRQPGEPLLYEELFGYKPFEFESHTVKPGYSTVRYELQT